MILNTCDIPYVVIQLLLMLIGFGIGWLIGTVICRAIFK